MCRPAAFLLCSSLVTAEGVGHGENPETAVSVFGPAPRLEQVAVTVAERERAVEFYRANLGLPVLMETNEMAFFDLGGTRLMLGADEGRPTFGRPAVIIDFRTVEFHASVSLLQSRDVEPVAPIETVTTTETGKLMLAQFHDPDGNVLAVMGEAPTP